MALGDFTQITFNDGAAPPINSVGVLNPWQAKTKELDTEAAASVLRTRQRGGDLLINGDFQVAQQGTVFNLVTTQAYTLDQWFVDTITTTVDVTREANVSTLFNAAYTMKMIGGGANWRMKQNIENNNNVLDGKASTLSFWVKGTGNSSEQASIFRSGSGTPIQDIPYDVTSSWTKIELTFAASTSWVTGENINIFPIYSTSTLQLELANVKLELGSTATDFIPNTFADELLASQNYLAKLTYTQSSGAYPLCFAYAATTTSLRGIFSIPREMRAEPVFDIQVTGGGAPAITARNADVGSIALSAGNFTVVELVGNNITFNVSGVGFTTNDIYAIAFVEHNIFLDARL